MELSEAVLRNSSNPFTPDEEYALRMIILVIGSVSLLSGIFVVMTFLAFQEKRKFGAWSLNCMFSLCVSLTELLLVIGGAMGFDTLLDENGNPSAFCKAQGSGSPPPCLLLD